jgi:type III secretion protein W
MPGGREHAPQHQPPASGSYRGEQVVVAKDLASVLQEAAEELTFVASTRTDRGDISKRKVENKNKGQNIDKVAKISDNMAKLPRFPRHMLGELLTRLRNMPERNPDQMREELKRFHPDITYQHVALEWALETLEEEGNADPELLRVGRQVVAENLRDHGAVIQAGLNVSGAAESYGGDAIEAVQELRDFYRETVLGYDGLKQTFASITEKYGDQDIGHSLAFLIRAIGDDLAAQGPSVEPARLKQILDDVYQLEALATLRERCATLVSRLDNRFGVKEGVGADEVMRELLELTGQSWLHGEQFSQIGVRLGMDDIEGEIYFLRELKEIVRALPLKVHADDESRDRMLTAAQEALDAAIETEENA